MNIGLVAITAFLGGLFLGGFIVFIINVFDWRD